MNKQLDNLHEAFMAMTKIYMVYKERPKKKRRYMFDAYKSFLKGNWSRLPKSNPNKVTNTFGTM